MANRFTFDKVGFRRLANSPDVQRHMKFVADHWADELRRNAPYDESGDEHYRDNIHTEVGDSTRRVQATNPRQAGFIIADTRYASALEFGNSRMTNPPQPMTKLLDQMQAADPSRRKKGR